MTEEIENKIASLNLRLHEIGNQVLSGMQQEELKPIMCEFRNIVKKLGQMNAQEEE